VTIKRSRNVEKMLRKKGVNSEQLIRADKNELRKDIQRGVQQKAM
jgi:hypothetical protein